MAPSKHSHPSFFTDPVIHLYKNSNEEDVNLLLKWYNLKPWDSMFHIGSTNVVQIAFVPWSVIVWWWRLWLMLEGIIAQLEAQEPTS